jgi:hypothetical protein
MTEAWGWLAPSKPNVTRSTPAVWVTVTVRRNAALEAVPSEDVASVEPANGIVVAVVVLVEVDEVAVVVVDPVRAALCDVPDEHDGARSRGRLRRTTARKRMTEPYARARGPTGEGPSPLAARRRSTLV